MNLYLTRAAAIEREIRQPLSEGLPAIAARPAVGLPRLGPQSRTHPSRRAIGRAHTRPCAQAYRHRPLRARA